MDDVTSRPHYFAGIACCWSFSVDSTHEISLSVFGGGELKISSEVAQKVGSITVAYHCHDFLYAFESCYQKFMGLLDSELYQIRYRRETGLNLENVRKARRREMNYLR